jgi:hypothetical protein
MLDITDIKIGVNIDSILISLVLKIESLPKQSKKDFNCKSKKGFKLSGTNLILYYKLISNSF